MGISPEVRCSYEAARSDDGSFSADELTLAGDEDLPLSPEELAFADPLHDEKIEAQRKGKHSRGKSLTNKMREWMYLTFPQAKHSWDASFASFEG